MSSTVETITELPLVIALGSEFDGVENQKWLAGWAERWMALAPTAAFGWQSNGTDLVWGSLLWDRTNDWLEIDIELRRGPKGVDRSSQAPDPVWTLNTVLMVSCWCQDNHNAHYIEELRWDVGSVEALTQRASIAYTVAERWVTTSMDADDWRRRVGLPLRPRSPDRAQ